VEVKRLRSCIQIEGEKFSHLLKRHPCFNGEAHFKYGRIHLPVSPACNIQCRFCRRGFNKWEQRPGVSRSLLTPEKAVEIIERALEICPEITVVGIAGPGDTLATDHALETFEMVHERFPGLINCLSTNGLMLEAKAERAVGAGIKTITVTVNAVDPGVLRDICAYIVHHGQYMTGELAARQLITAQLAGISKATRLGAVVKINTVLIPGVNDCHVEEVARVTAGAGASVINIIPLIPQYEMEQYRPPDCQELNTARAAAEKHLTVFRHCRQCRADACGVPGSGIDLGDVLYEQRLPTFSHG
jgi:nitrogen fixation protein NifB